MAASSYLFQNQGFDHQMHADIFCHPQSEKMVTHNSQAQSQLSVPPYTYIEWHPDHLHEMQYPCMLKMQEEQTDL